MTYQEILKEFGEEAAEAFLEWRRRGPEEEYDAETGDAIHDYLKAKGRL